MIWLLNDQQWFPDPQQAREDGLVAVGGDLSVARLVLAYRTGVFPWSAEPITWWSPDPRAVFELTAAGLHLPRSLARTLRQNRFTVTVNRDFAGVIRACATVPRDSGTWISPAFIQAYTGLHQAGHAHSIEVWQGDDLVGGLYGVAVGGFFAGESMFHRVTDASKVALVHTHRRLCERGFTLFDTQMVTSVTGLLGAVEISRPEYLRRLKPAVELDCRFG